ncbi:hypothetical protein [Ancrocorticia populi]|uniref:hypothetical protein n=1 Tax=Ancrocorticia populi TaxID=2175228 RepID=UPI0023561F6A|nr:hypothetical protein [Ancrocorticia populi]
MVAAYVPNGLLSRLLGDRMYSVEFVLNDYVQFKFDGAPDARTPVTLSVYAWPVVEIETRTWREGDLGYADALRQLAPSLVIATSEQTGRGIRIELSTGALTIHPTAEEARVEIAMIAGWSDGAWMLWRPGKDSFEDLC